jgi:hypothetical protein
VDVQWPGFGCSERFYALAMLACSVICFNALQQPP